jgi:hypothetical protein
MVGVTAYLLVILYPGTLWAEVSDKEFTVSSFWTVGISAAILCLVCTRIKPWLGMIYFVPVALWFVCLFVEIHSPDVRPYLRLEQGGAYYFQAYAAFASVALGLVAGYIWRQRKHI